MFLFTILSYVGATVLFLIIGWYVYVQQFAKYLKSLPGPTPLPVLGNALLFRDHDSLLKTIQSLFTEHKIVKIWIGFEPIIAITDYKAVEAILSSTKLIEKSKLYKFLHPWLGAGLLTSSGAKWKSRRRLLTPTYHFKILEDFIPTFDKVANKLVKQLQLIENKNSVDIYHYVTLSTLDVICETAMGVSINALEHTDSEYVQSVKKMGRITVDRIFSPIGQVDFLYRLTKNYQIGKKCLEILHKQTNAVIKARREELSKGSNDSKEVCDEYGSKRKLAFLDMLLQTSENGQPLTDEAIREEVDTFMFEGHDTTASGISFALFCIAKHPEVQEKILQEQTEIFNNSDRPTTYQDLVNMKYLELVIKEVMRLYPSVPFFAREVVEDTQIKDDVWLPKGSTVTIITYQIHRDPDYFPEPEKFIPERFLQENNQETKLLYSFVPFSAGPRNCIGQKFAILEMKSTLSKIVRHFQLSPVVPTHEPLLVPETILKSNNGILIKLQERSHN